MGQDPRNQYLQVYKVPSFVKKKIIVAFSYFPNSPDPADLGSRPWHRIPTSATQTWVFCWLPISLGQKLLQESSLKSKTMICWQFIKNLLFPRVAMWELPLPTDMASASDPLVSRWSTLNILRCLEVIPMINFFPSTLPFYIVCICCRSVFVRSLMERSR